MTTKIQSFLISKGFLRCVLLNPCCSFNSSTACAQCLSGYDQNPVSVPDSEAVSSSPQKNIDIGRPIWVLDSRDDLSSVVKEFKRAFIENRHFRTSELSSLMNLKMGIARNLEELDHFVKEMIKVAPSHREEACAFLIGVLCTTHRITEALRVFEIMNKANCRPSVSTCDVLLRAIVEDKKDFKSAMFVYKEMVKAAIVPSIETLNCIIQILCLTDRIDSALDQFRRLKNKGCSPNSRTFNIIIHGLFLRNRVDQMIEILNEMFENGHMPDRDFYNNTIPLFYSLNRLDEVFRLFQKMGASNYLPDVKVYEITFGCFMRSLLLDDAAKLILDMLKIGLKPSVDMYLEIISAHCRLGKFIEAMTFLDDAAISEAAPYNVLLEAYCFVGRFPEAYALLRKMAENHLSNNMSWNVLIGGFCENGSVGNAFEVLTTMIAYSYMPDDITYSSLITGYCRIGCYNIALKLFSQVQRKGWCLSSASYDELIDGLCHAGKIQEATDAFHYMSSKGCCLSSVSCNLLVNGICLMEKVDRAIKIRSLAFCVGTSSSPSTFAVIMHALCKFNRSEGALVLLSQMLVEGCTLDADVYCILIRSMCNENKSKYASLLFDQMVRDGFSPDMGTLNTLISCMENQCQLHTLSNSLEKIKSRDECLSPAMYNLVIISLWKEGHKQEACKFLDWMLEKGWVPDAVTHGLLIRNTNKYHNGLSTEFGDFDVDDKVANILAEGLDICNELRHE